MNELVTARPARGKLYLAISIPLLLFIAWVIVLAVPGLILILIFITVRHPGIYLSLILVPIIALGFVVFRTSWRSGLVLLTLLGGASTACIVPNAPQSPAGWLSQVCRIFYYRSTLHRFADDAKARGGTPALGVLDLDGFGSLTSGIAYDPSRQLSLAPADRTPEWLRAAAQTELSVDGIEAHHVFGDYYWWFHD